MDMLFILIVASVANLLFARHVNANDKDNGILLLYIAE